MTCLLCEAPTHWAGSGRRPVYCSTACRKEAFRLREALPALLGNRGYWATRARTGDELMSAARYAEVLARIDRDIAAAQRCGGRAIPPAPQLRSVP